MRVTVVLLILLQGINFPLWCCGVYCNPRAAVSCSELKQAAPC